jgi:hypothetical protein
MAGGKGRPMVDGAWLTPDHEKAVNFLVDEPGQKPFFCISPPRIHVPRVPHPPSSAHRPWAAGRVIAQFDGVPAAFWKP